MISDISGMKTKEMSIRHNGQGSPLVFEYLAPNRKINSNHTIKNNDHINFTSNLKDDQTLWVETYISHIKPISSALLSDTMEWYIDDNKSIMIKALLDGGAVEIKILTPIIDNRVKETKDNMRD
jgi:hypothetical protein